MHLPEPLWRLSRRENHELTTTERERALVARAAAQDFVMSLAGLATLGFSPTEIAHRVRQGRLVKLHRGVYHVGPGRPTRAARWRAAALATGPGSAVAARSACAMYEVRPDSRAVVDVIGRGRSRAGLVIHRAVLPAEEVAEIDGIPVTVLGRALVDLAATHPEHVPAAFRRAEQAQIFDLFELEEVIARAPTRRGVAGVRRALAGHHPLAAQTHSIAELRYLLLLAGAGVAVGHVNTTHHGFELDFAWPELRLNIEIDGPHHETAHQRARDAARDEVLRAHGWVVVRIPVGELRDAPLTALARTRAALRRGGFVVVGTTN